MAELQEVQITEEKPLLPGQTPEVAKVNRDPPTPRPEVQACGHPPRLLPSQIHDLFLTHTRFLPLYPCHSPIHHNGSQAFVLSLH